MAIAGIVAGGTGTRMGGDIPKQFITLCGKPIIIHTIEAFLSHPEIKMVIVGVHPNWLDEMKKMASQITDKKVSVVSGGSDRNGTLLNIINHALSLGFPDNEIILTHDAVRPFVSDKMISDSISAMNDCEICTTVIPSSDTLIYSGDGKHADDFPLRSRMFQVQTPQTFRLGSFKRMYEALSPSEREQATDACRLYHRNNKKVRLVEGSPGNIKLTYPSDLLYAEAVLSSVTTA